MHKIGQPGWFLVRPLGPLLKPGLPLMKNILKPLAKSVLIPLGLTAVALATVAAIYKKMFGSGTTTLIISKKEMNDILKIIKSFEESGLLIKRVIVLLQLKMKQKNKRRISGNVIRRFSARLLENLLTGKETVITNKSTIRGGQDF